MSNFQLYKKAISATGTTTENEPIIKSDGASSNVMQWLSNNEASNITISEDGSNNLDLVVSAGNVGIGVTPEGLLSVSGAESNTAKILFQNAHSVTGDGAISTYDDADGTDVIVGSNFYMNGSGTYTRYNTGEQSSAISLGRGGELDLMTGPTGATASTRLRINSAGSVTVTGAAGSGFVSYNDGVALSGYVGSGVSLSPTDFGNTDLVVRAQNDLVFVASDGTGLADRYQASISGTTGVMTVKQPGWPLKNELTNSGFDVWSNSTLEDVGSELVTNGTFASDYAGWTLQRSAVLSHQTDKIRVTNGGGVASGVAEQQITVVEGKLYKLTYDIKTVSGVASAYIRVSTGSATSGTFYVSETPVVGDGQSVVFEATTGTTLFVALQNYAGSDGDYCEFDNITLKEVTPGISSGALAFDSWYMDSGTAIQRQHNDGGSYTKDGSFYALKATGNGKEIYWPISNAFSTSDMNEQRFAGRTVTFGAWVKSDDGTYLRVRDGVTANSDSTAHTGDNTWQWLEVTKEVSPSATLFSVAFILDGTAANYISQPMLVFGSAIGSGNYSRPSGEIVWCEKSVDSATMIKNGYGPVSTTALNLEADSNGAIPKGAKAVHAWLQVADSNPAGVTSARMNLSTSIDSRYGVDIYLGGLPAVGNGCVRAAAGFVGCDSDGDIVYKIDASGSDTFDVYGLRYQAVQLR